MAIQSQTETTTRKLWRLPLKDLLASCCIEYDHNAYYSIVIDVVGYDKFVEIISQNKNVTQQTKV